MCNIKEIKEDLINCYKELFPERSDEELEQTVEEIIKHYGGYPNFIERVIRKLN